MTGNKLMIHVHPLNDDYEHTLTREDRCWCEPTLEQNDGATIVIHHAHDGREEVEKEIDDCVSPDKMWAHTEV